MPELNGDYFVSAGFERETSKKYSDLSKVVENVPTGRFLNHNWEPAPVVEMSIGGLITAKIGSLRWEVTTITGFEKFLSVMIPTFCDLK